MTINQFFVLFSRRFKAIVAGVAAFICIPAFATTFTSNATIGVGNTNYDGADIVVSNCTLTVDGPHTFSSLLVAGGGVLTHSFSPSGIVSNLFNVTTENQVLSGTNQVTLLNSNVIATTISVTDFSGTNFYTNGLDYSLTSPDGVLTQLQRTTNSTIVDGATVLVSYESLLGTASAGLNLSVTNNVQVDVGGSINANAIGYSFGPGAGRSAGSPHDGSGGGYGGIGGTSSSNALGGFTYGSFTQPANLGSGGGGGSSGIGGAGGGMIQITAGGAVIVNGSISANGANGTNSRSGGGSGGSIWITGLSLSGAGSITANGGAGEPSHGGGGGGGRISIRCNSTTFTGSTKAYGGAGATSGGAGTVYTKVDGQHGLLVLDNGGQSGTNTTVSISDSTIDVLIKGHAGVLPSGTWNVGNLTVATNGLLLANSGITLSVNSSGAIVVEAGGSVLANGVGPQGSGFGRSYNDGVYRPCGGGGYGGNGASGFLTNAFGGTSYGSQSSPNGSGSAGGSLLPYSIGGNGGGGIQFTSQDGIVQVDGTISANGANGSGSGGGGGSGGTISLTGGILLGSGSITATGGSGVDSIGGGGGGGRIYLHPTANLFSGAISAAGGGGANWGGAGTVLVQVTGQNAQLILDNSGHTGTNTVVQQPSGLTDLIVRGGAIGSASSAAVSFANLYVSSNAWLCPLYNTILPANSVNFSITGNATIQAGGGIIADLAGYPAGSGAGAGHFYSSYGSTNFCSGAGHGGAGGSSAGKYALGGNTYDSPTSPGVPGSGGGSPSLSALGGAGGGSIRLTVGGTLQLDGIISAGGGNGVGLAGGGGAGGSIWLSVGTLLGAGSIAANGGNGAAGIGGGGGGGMIYIPCNNNAFSGTMTAYGGGGANWGGAGTTIIQVSGRNSQLIVDGGGNPGAPTPLPNSSTMDLVLRNGAVGLATYSMTAGNLLISSNSWLVFSNYPYSSSAITCTSATIQAGGGIIADSLGYAAGQGPSAGRSYGGSPIYACSGGGNGGTGGNSISNLALGGNASLLKQAGSGGGTYSPYSIGGAGGGSITLTVSGLLKVDGIISANGGDGSGLGGGGGAGGAITLSSGSMSGTGVIRANGGSGVGSVGGGGGGGGITISVNSTANQFTGTISAYGGGGANWGGAGPISTQTTGTSAPNIQLVLDAGGNPGPATPVPSSSSSTSLTLRNGAIGLVNYSSLTLGSLLITSNSWLVVSNSPTSAATLTFSSATIQAGGGITADSQGYAAGLGSGAGHPYQSSPNYPCSGAGHGGIGGKSSTNSAVGGTAYDSQTFPNFAGSGGGSYSPYSLGGAGGGGVAITVSGLLQLEGIISANGGDGGGIGGGGGSGGSIRLNAGTLAGSGAIRANGGDGAGAVGGGGAGGRIVIYPNVNLFTGTISAYGGGGANSGGAGTISMQTSGQNAELVLDAGGNPGPATPVTSSSSSTSLTLRNGAIGLVNYSSLTLGSLLITSNSWLVVSNFPGNAMEIIFSSATIQAGGGITADSQGYAAGSGNGAGRGSGASVNYPCSGAGHGGNGGNITIAAKDYVAGGTLAGGIAYDNQLSPGMAGSGGGSYSTYSLGGTGGGALSITVRGLLQVEGIISANGGNGSGLGGGGGSGGGIELSASILAGSGTIRANGGNGAGAIGGGGAGGCIAIYSTTNLFTGTISAAGGGGASWGGAGTICLQTGQQSFQLVLDNGGQAGAGTPIQSLSSSTALILRNGAAGYQQSTPQTFGSLLISSNAWLMANTNFNLVNLTLTGNATIQAGGGIVADGAVDTEGFGNGPGHSYYGPVYQPCSGGGHGGYGGIANANSSFGGLAYDSITSPTSNGSGGGSYSPYSFGGAGGGAIRLIVNGTLATAGRISANGGNGSGLGGGGGSGGSVFITVGTFAGNGVITANGGDGVEGQGGGGGGGRISIGYNSKSFAGLMAAYGGGGYEQGGAGTIYTKANSQSMGPVLVDNGGVAGAATPLSGLPSLPVNLTVQNGAVVCPQTSSLQLSNLTVGTGGLFTVLTNLTRLDLMVFNNVDVAPGGAISVDGEGYGYGQGVGKGQSSGGFGGGAGYGGVGGASATAPGGVSYGSAVQPVDFGSGGGIGSVAGSDGSAGGGAIRLSVGGILNVNGELSASGEMGLQDNSGGGSGGSIWVDAGTLAGSGRIAADGGEGELFGGGGGAGGRIALYSRANIFHGLTSAAGALGDFSGADGTIFKSSGIPQLQVLSNSPSGVVTSGVSSVTLYFNDAPNPNSVSSAAISLMTPNGPLSSGSISISQLSFDSYQVSFPRQTAVGNYTLTVGGNITDRYGQALAQVYTGTFIISLPVIQGTIMDSNGNPVSGVTIQPSGGLSSTTTDTNGNYALGFVPGSSFTVTSSLGSLQFVPSAMSYTNVSTSVSNQNYVAVSTLAPLLGARVNSNNFVLSWQAIPGVNYQVYSSTNLVDWQRYGSALTDSNGPVQFLVPVGGNPQQFFSVQPSD